MTSKRKRIFQIIFIIIIASIALIFSNKEVNAGDSIGSYTSYDIEDVRHLRRTYATDSQLYCLDYGKHFLNDNDYLELETYNLGAELSYMIQERN